MTAYQTTPASTIKEITGKAPMAWSGEGDNRDYTETELPVIVLNFRGRDCDGFDIDRINYALPENVEDEIDSTLEWADGPMGYAVLTADELREWFESRQYRESRAMRKGWDDDRF